MTLTVSLRRSTVDVLHFWRLGLRGRPNLLLSRSIAENGADDLVLVLRLAKLKDASSTAEYQQF